MLTTLASDTQTTADTQRLATSHILNLRSWNIAGAFLHMARLETVKELEMFDLNFFEGTDLWSMMSS
jgi:hypothetical protein